MKRLLVLAILAMCAGTAIAQTSARNTGLIFGTVKDRSGDVLPGANLTVTDRATTLGVMTDARGQYRVANLPEGVYSVEASYIGYRTGTQHDVLVSPGVEVRADFVLEHEAILQDQIIVSASRKKEKILDAPASVALMEADEIRDGQTVNAGQHVKTMTGVDFVQVGLSQTSTVVRGFNNVFSGALLTLVDNRIARVPSLRVNVHNFIPLTNDDIERIEVVLGPGSALYGPNSANGVLHFITRSPFDSPGTTVSVGGGERSLRSVSVRQSNVLSDKAAIKVSGQYYDGTDWKYEDPEETRLRGSNPRDYDLSRKSSELRLDLKPSDDVTAIFSLGYTEASNIELTGLGAAQAKEWSYMALQGRLLYKDWFAQVFHNRSDAGKTRLLRTNQPIVDKSTLTVFQIQHAFQMGPRQRFTYGTDILYTRPNTETTINGANEDNDDVNEFGFYLQSETKLGEMVDLVAAARFDDHNHINEAVFSPRVAVVLKPDPTNTVRFTYNRAFSTPTSNNLFLDLVASPDVYGLGANFGPAMPFDPAVDLRTQGSMTGFTYNRDSNGLPTFRSPFAPLGGKTESDQINLHDPVFTNVMWNVGRGAVMNGFVPTVKQAATGVIAQQLIAGGTAPDVAMVQAAAQADLLAAAFNAFVPSALPGLQNALMVLDHENKEEPFSPVSDIQTSIVDIAKIRQTTTETFEVGYKGVLGGNLVLSADVYRTKTKDFVGPLRVETPNVFLDATSLGAALGAAFTAGLQVPAIAPLAGVLALLDTPAQGGNGNCTVVDELTRLFVAGTANNGAAYIPYGTVTAKEANDPTAVMLTYRNFGNVTLNGLDLALGYYPDERLGLHANYSYISKNLFRNLGGIDDIALNAPLHKLSVGAKYRFVEQGLTVGARIRYRDKYEMDSGVYVGDIDAKTVVDMDVAYDLPINIGNGTVTAFMNATNLFDTRKQEFIGAPKIGRLISGGLTARF